MFKSLKRRVALGAVAAVGAAGLVTIAAPAANALPSSTGVSVLKAVGRVGLGINLQVGVTVPTSGAKTDYLHIALAANGAPATATLGSVRMATVGLTDTATSSGISLSTSGFSIETSTSASTLININIGQGTVTSGVGGLIAGTYKFLVWASTTNGSEAVPPSDAIIAVASVTLGGIPASIALDKTTYTAASSVAATPVATLKDAAGVATILAPYEYLSLAVPTAATSATVTSPASRYTMASGASGTGIYPATGTFNGRTDGFDAQISDTSTGTAQTGTALKGPRFDFGSYTFGVLNSSAGSTTLTVSAGGSLANQLTDATATLTTFTAVAATNMAPDALADGLSNAAASYSAPDSYTAAGNTNTVYASTTNGLSVKWNANTASAVAGNTVVYAISAITGRALPSGISATAGVLTTNALGVVSVTTTASAATAGTGFNLNVGGISLNVVYTTPVPVNISMLPYSSITATKLGTVSLSASVGDQFADAYPGALVTFKYASGTGGRNGTAGTVVATGTTGATGSTSFTFTDYGTNASISTDSIDANATWAGNAGAAITSAAAYKSTVGFDKVVVTWATSIAPAKIVVVPFTGTTDASKSNNLNTTVAAGFSALAPGIQTNQKQTYSATVTDATGALLAGVAVKFTFTGGVTSAVTGATTTTKYTDGTGVAYGSVYTTTTGKLTAKAEIGSVSGSDATVTVFNIGGSGSSTCTATTGLQTLALNATTLTVTTGCTDARVLSLDSTTYAVTGGQVKRVSATVKDALGNPVPGITVSFAMTGIGRFAGGALSSTGVTDATGVAITDLAPLASESGAGTLTATIAYSDPTVVTAGLTNTAAAAYPEAVKKVTATITTTAGAATATTDAATTSKINDIATAVANLSTTVAGLVASLVAQIKDTKAAIADTKAALDALAAVVAKIQKKVKA